MTIAPVLAAILEVQYKSRLHRWLGEFYTGGEKLTSNFVRVPARRGLIFEVHVHIRK